MIWCESRDVVQSRFENKMCIDITTIIIVSYVWLVMRCIWNRSEAINPGADGLPWWSPNKY